MQVTSVNIGQQQSLQNGSRKEITGIFKLPTSGSVAVTSIGLQGDVICDSKHHGGPDQAIYIYGAADYAWWSGELGYEVIPGTFGENLTISELESASFWIGDRLKIGDVVLEVSAPRIPCGTLAARVGDPKFVKRFRQAERPGLYCRVIQPGMVQIGATVSIEKVVMESISVIEVFRAYYEKEKGEHLLRRHLNAPVAIRIRDELEPLYQKMIASK
jgi:MOSC domain-containing protein YiiM